ncbi:MAG TPA: cobyrinate a,c-diamide synthase, partial [Acidimicrobiales bacterium]|nr:cobyrinate a,c-diamide synthase [Acidimicrobiales bacterium]
LAGRAAAGADVLVVEGVMGLFDGAAVPGPDASTASVARLLDAPVVLVVDASAMSRSVAAVVHGFATFEPGVRVGGVILNRVGGPGHVELLAAALAPSGIPVLGALARDDRLTWRDRHLGLVPVAEDRAAVEGSVRALAEVVAGAVDLDAVMALARSAPAAPVGDPPFPRPAGRARVAVAGGPAFTFVYQDNLEALEAAGAELVPFDPVADPALPAGTGAVYAGGGFPEVYAAALAANAPLLAELRTRVDGGMAVWAECGGLLWLARRLDGAPLAGVVPADGRLTDRLTLGYRTATARTDSPLTPAGGCLRGHEFHYSTLDPPGDAFTLEGRNGTARAGWAGPRLAASYLHLHLGGDPAPASRFVATAAAAGSRFAGRGA